MLDAPELPPIAAPGTRDRLIAAALKIFSRDGLQGATTRAIAQEAGVSEVTLFRHFQTKEGLLEELLKSLVAAAVAAGHHSDPDERARWAQGNLKANLLRYAERHYGFLVTREAFIRTMIGEARRHPDYSRKIILEAAAPVTADLVANLEAARKAGKVRKGIDLHRSAEIFLDTLLSGMLRHTAGCSEAGTPEEFLATCVDIFSGGLAPKQ